MNDIVAPDLTAALVPEPEGFIPLSQFVADFGESLLAAVTRQNPPIHDGTPDPHREAVMDALKRAPFAPQRAVVQAVARLLADAGEQAAIITVSPEAKRVVRRTPEGATPGTA